MGTLPFFLFPREARFYEDMVVPWIPTSLVLVFPVPSRRCRVQKRVGRDSRRQEKEEEEKAGEGEKVELVESEV